MWRDVKWYLSLQIGIKSISCLKACVFLLAIVHLGKSSSESVLEVQSEATPALALLFGQILGPGIMMLQAVKSTIFMMLLEMCFATFLRCTVIWQSPFF